MAVDVARWLRDFGVEVKESGRPGWVHVHCPFCSGSQDWHLGYSLRKDFWNCWRCGGHRGERVAYALTRTDWQEVRRRYPLRDGGAPHAEPPPRDRKGGKFRPPPGTLPLPPRHAAYLASRGFSDVPALVARWGLLGTGPVGGHEKLRVIAPVTHRGRVVTWQGRDVTGRAPAKYWACPPALEARPIKHCLYGLDLLRPDRGAVVVEGVVDAWKLGPGAVATFGTAWDREQLTLLLELPRVFVLFDGGEEDAQRHAASLLAQLREAGVRAEQILLDEGDPGDLSEDDAAHLMRDLRLK